MITFRRNSHQRRLRPNGGRCWGLDRLSLKNINRYWFMYDEFPFRWQGRPGEIEKCIHRVYKMGNLGAPEDLDAAMAEQLRFLEQKIIEQNLQDQIGLWPKLDYAFTMGAIVIVDNPVRFFLTYDATERSHKIVIDIPLLKKAV